MGNEGHHGLKRRGYYRAHNCDHGHQHLSAVLGLCGPRRTFSDDPRAPTRYLPFRGWDELLGFTLGGGGLDPLGGGPAR